MRVLRSWSVIGVSKVKKGVLLGAPVPMIQVWVTEPLLPLPRSLCMQRKLLKVDQ